MSKLVKQKAIEETLHLGPAATRRLLNDLERAGKIQCVRINSRVKRYPFEDTIATIAASSTAVLGVTEVALGE